jgi:hypothetical protein
MFRCTTLNELDTSLEVFHHRLKTLGIPPFRREVILASGNDNPEIVSDSKFREEARLLFFLLCEINLAMKLGYGNCEPELLFQVLGVCVYEVVRALIALVNQRVVHIQRLNARIGLVQRRNMGVVVPQFIGRRPHIRLILVREGGV